MHNRNTSDHPRIWWWYGMVWIWYGWIWYDGILARDNTAARAAMNLLAQPDKHVYQIINHRHLHAQLMLGCDMVNSTASSSVVRSLYGGFRHIAAHLSTAVAPICENNSYIQTHWLVAQRIGGATRATRVVTVKMIDGMMYVDVGIWYDYDIWMITCWAFCRNHS